MTDDIAWPPPWLTASAMRAQLEVGSLTDPFAVIDVSSWPAAGDEQVGTKPKVWLIGPDGARWLFKRSRLPPRVRAEDWSEKLATEIAMILGVPVAPVELATRLGGDVSGRGTISRDVARHEGIPLALDHGSALLHDRWPEHDPRASGVLRTYTLDRCIEVLDAVGPPPGREELGSGIDAFLGYLVLDATIGNTDRHHNNWGVLTGTGLDRPRLCPSFDHSTSLGFNVSARQIAAVLAHDDAALEQHVRGAKSRFAGRAPLVELVRRGCGLASAAGVERWSHAVAALDRAALSRLIARVPAEIMSEEERMFVEVVVTERIRRVSGVLDAARRL